MLCLSFYFSYSADNLHLRVFYITGREVACSTLEYVLKQNMLVGGSNTTDAVTLVSFTWSYRPHFPSLCTINTLVRSIQTFEYYEIHVATMTGDQRNNGYFD